MRFSLEEVARATGGRLHPGKGGSTVVTRVVADSRLAAKGDLFVAVVAARDGHGFVADAFEAGATAALVSRRVADGPVVEVADTLAGLASLAVHARSRLHATVAAVTGSTGKTTTKDLLAAILAESRSTARSLLSHNNELGVPLTLVNASVDARAVVLEMGARGPGHIAHLCGIARPDLAVVTNVGSAHLATFGDLGGVARAKSEIVAGLGPDGVAVLNADDPRVVAMAVGTEAAVWSFGTSSVPGAAAEVVHADLEVDAELRPRFTLHTPVGSAELRLMIRGRHQAANAAAAAAAALALGATLDEVVAGLSGAGTGPWRMQVSRAPSGALVVNDAYNANPESTMAALDAVSTAPGRRHVAVLGPMLELGEASAAAHQGVAAAARDLGVEVLAVGTDAYGGPAQGVTSVSTVEELIEHLGELGDGDVVLVKGSRAAGLEALAEALLGSGDAGARAW